ncbi:MAG TPA: N-acetylglucosamine-6-phosphate deacetylase [Actinoplanes sp.]
MIRVGGRIVRPGGVEPGYVEVDGPTILSVTSGPHAGDDVIVPGFVDLHCHGGGGHTFTTGDAAQARAAAGFHLAHGTTTMLASLVSSPYELMRGATEAYAPLVTNGVIAGVHFEGPYLSAVRCGAQNPQFLRDPSPDELTELIRLGAGAVRMVTIAPELPGALESIALLTEQGVIAAVGHTDATYEQAKAGVAAGATVGTHVFNGMRPPHHREPGPVIALLGARTVVCELIADGVHLHPGMLSFAARAAGPDRTALITDAMDAAGMSDGRYDLAGQEVIVSGGVARLARDGSIAGSTLTMDAVLRQTVAAGIALADASTMASATPARALSLADEVGALEAGLRADLVVLSPDLHVKRVMRAGTWVA